jgi:hypothetical protein
MDKRREGFHGLTFPGVIAKVAKRGPNAGWWRVRDAIKYGMQFENSSRTFRGSPVTCEPSQILRGELADGYWDAMQLGRPDYVVWSYETPIAWRVGGCWVTPDENYSPTTCYHQSQINTAICALETEQ